MWGTLPSYLDAAEDAARWIRATAQETPQGLVWLPEPDHPEKTTTITAPATLYSGSAGIVLFLIELGRATGNATYLDEARRGADQIAATWREVLDAEPLIPLPNAQFDFAMGLAGTAFTLGQAWLAFGDNQYRDAALAILREIAAAARPTAAGVTWTGSPTVGLGDGSIILTLLWGARTFDDAALRELARRAGDEVLARGVDDPRGGRRWPSPDLSAMGMPVGASMPNFELGTAGVAFVLARLAVETGEARFLDAAKAAAAHIQALATVDGDAALLYYREPDMTDLYYLGYCHGPVGTARPFYALYEATHDPDYLAWAERFARGIVASGVPEHQTPGLWNVVCQCCGTAGIADFFTGLWAATGKPEHLAFARRVADHLLSHATDVDGAGSRWYQAWTRTQPWNVNAETGYMIGAAGVGSALVHLHLANEGKYSAILFPDNSFPQALSRGF